MGLIKFILLNVIFICLAPQLVSGWWFGGSGCRKNADCSTRWCEGGSIFKAGSCKPKRNDGQSCSGRDGNSCKSGHCTCSTCGSDGSLPDGSGCAMNTNCASGWCQGTITVFCRGICQPKRADKQHCDDNVQCRGGICEGGICKGEDVVALLARCAKDVYSFDGEWLGNRLKLLYKQEQKFAEIQFGVYQILFGANKGKKIMAFRGTDTSSTIDVQSALGIGTHLHMAVTRTQIKRVIERVREQNPDYVTGHSLGGFYAEIASATFGLPGASFNAPGPRKVIKHRSFMPANPKFNVGFGVHLTRGDAVSLVGSLVGVAWSHVSKPVWYSVHTSHDLKVVHSMDEMLKHFIHN